MFLLNLLNGTTATDTTNQTQTPAQQIMDPISIVIMVVLLVAVVGLFIWSTISNRKKQKEAQEMVGALKIGDRVKTIGGICGFVAQINDAENTFVLETGLEETKSYIKFDKGAIYQTAPAQGNAVAAPVETKEEAPAEQVKAETTAESANEQTVDKPKKPRAKKVKSAQVEVKEETTAEQVENETENK